MLRIALICAALLTTMPGLSVFASEPELIYVDDISELSPDYPRTDGRYVIWRESSHTTQMNCFPLFALDLEQTDPVTLKRDGNAYAIQDGFAIVSASDKTCNDGSQEVIDGGVSLLNLDTGQTRTLMSTATAGWTALDLPYAAWVEYTVDFGVSYATIWAMNVDTDVAPTQVHSFERDADAVLGLYLVGDTVYWTQGETFTTDYDTGRAQIGGQVSFFRSLHDTTEVVIAGNAMVTITEDRPLLYDLSTGQTRWLADSGTDVATDGRYVFWSVSAGRADSGESILSIVGMDLQTNARFTVWQAPTDTGSAAGLIDSIDVGGEGLAWQHYGFDGGSSAIYATPIADRLPSAYQPDSGTTSPDWTYYPETGHYLANDFRTFWEGNGGLPVFGYPMTEEFDFLSPETGTSHIAQMTERQRFEWHPENIGTPYAVLLGRLGETILVEQGRDWTTFEKADPSADHYFAETGHAIAPEFYGYWSTHGLDLGHAGNSFEESVALFGFPLSEPMMETNADGDTVLTQYFERAVFEHHPDNPASSQVLLRRLGAELMDSWGW